MCVNKKKQIKAIDLSCFCRTRVIGHASTVATKYKKSEANHTWMTPPPKLSLRACKNSEGKPIILPSQSITNDSNSVQAGLEAFSAQYMETYRPMINGNGLINLEIDNMSWCIIVKSDATLLPKWSPNNRWRRLAYRPTTRGKNSEPGNKRACRGSASESPAIEMITI